MPVNWYAIIFAVFVVIQIVAWIIFAKKITKEVKNKEMAEMIEERESKIFRLYSNIEELMDAFEEYVDEVRTEIDHDHKELMEISRQSADIFSKAMQIKSAYYPQNEGETPRPDLPPGGGAPAAVQTQSQGKKENTQKGNITASKDKSIPSEFAEGYAPANQNRTPAASQDNRHFSTLSQKDRDAVRKFATKAQKVRYLISCGLTESEIARELDIGKGEVHLIAELEK